MRPRGRWLWIALLASTFACEVAAEENPGNQVKAAALQEADQLNQTVVKLYGEGRYQEALPYAKRALELRERHRGPEHPDTAASLNNLAELYRSMGAYAKAEPLYVRALAIREKALGPEHAGTATSLNNLALLYKSMGAYAKAEPLYVRALAIKEKALGPEHPGTATSLNNLAGLYDSMGAYAKAEPLYVRALTISERSLLVILTLCFAQAADAPAQTGATHRVALVIGNSRYVHLQPLRNPANDARLISETLRRMQFDRVLVSYDVDLEGMQAALDAFRQAARNADIALVYFAGHGIEDAGQNFLVPVDAGLGAREDIGREAVSVERVLEAVREASGLRLVLLDACRRSPFPARAPATSGAPALAEANSAAATGRGVLVGLAAPENLGEVLVAYGAKAGTIAQDGQGDNSPYATALAARLPSPGIDIRLVLGRVRDDVLTQTMQAQEPFVYGAVGGRSIYLITSDPEPPPAYNPTAWVHPNGPFYGGAEVLARDPTDASVLFAVRDRVYKSVNGGETWFGLAEDGLEARASSLAVSPADPAIILAGYEGHLLRRDRAGVWRRVPYFDRLDEAEARSMEFAADAPNLVYVATGIHFSGMAASAATAAVAGGEGGVVPIIWTEDVSGGHLHRSLDGGATWTTGPVPNTNWVTISSGQQPSIYAGTSDHGVYASADGETWRRFHCLTGSYVAKSIAISPRDPTRAAVATSRGLFLLSIVQAPYCAPLAAFQDQAVNAVAYSPDGGELLAGTDSGLFQSRDGGTSFERYDQGLYNKRILRLAYARNGEAVASIDLDGVARRSQQDAAWQIGGSRFVRQGVGAFASDGEHNLYVGAVLGVYVTENNGSTLRLLHRSDSSVMSLAFLPMRPASADQGVSWSRSGVLLAGIGNGEIHESTDSGATWRVVHAVERSAEHRDLPRIFGIEHAGANLVLAAAEWAGLLASDDAGATWRVLETSFTQERVVSASATGRRIYAGTGAGNVYVSNDRARTWSRVGQTLPGPVAALVAGGAENVPLWAAVEGGGPFALVGDAWSAQTHGVTDLHNYALLVDPRNRQQLYLASKAGVFSSSDEGQSWRRLSEGMPHVDEISALGLSPDGTILFAGEKYAWFGLRIH